MLMERARERLVEDIELWHSEGIIPAETLALLRERYQASEFGLVGVIKYLGIAGGLLAFFGLLGLVGAMVESEIPAAIFTLGIAGGFFYFGLRLSLDGRNRYAISSKVVLALGAVSLAAALAIVGHALGAKEPQVLLVGGLLWLPLVLLLAYRFKNPFLLLLGLGGLFHWVGSWNSMLGRSSYLFAIQDPRVMAVAALAAIGVGVYHERALAARTLRFFRVYQALGLLYLDMALLILSTGHDQGRLPYALLLAAAALGQLVVGARLKNGLMVGFGVTFLAANLFTRYYEQFWNSVDKGLFFLIGGALLFGAGVGCERLVARGVR
jgi:hypothetical protein